MVAWPSMSSSAEVNSMVPGSVVPREIASSAFGPLRTFVGLCGKHDSLDNGGLVWDQAGGAFGSAAVPRPSGSSFMPLRRTHRRPGPAKSLERRAPKPPAKARGWGSGLALRYGKTRPDPHGRVTPTDVTPTDVVECGEVRTPTSRTPKTQRRGRRSPAGAISGAPRSGARGLVRAAHFVIILAAVVRTERTK